jgi:hypothetical protein
MSTKATEWENVKLKKSVVNKLRSYKKKTGLAISVFAEKAILNYLKQVKNEQKETA